MGISVKDFGCPVYQCLPAVWYDMRLQASGSVSPGGQLWERVEAGMFSEAQAARIIREVLQLLAQAHSRNIIIRDIKPDNLLFLNHDEDAPLKAIDFGIATVCGPDEMLADRCGKSLCCGMPCPLCSDWLCSCCLFRAWPWLASVCCIASGSLPSMCGASRAPSEAC